MNFSRMVVACAGRTGSRLVMSAALACGLNGSFGLPGALAQAPAFPSKPLHMLVGFAAGGPTDLIARIVAPEMQARLGQPVIVENRPGASGAISIDAVKKAEPDGHTLVMLVTPTILNYHFLGQSFDASKDLAPIGMIYMPYNVVAINPQVPVVASVRTMTDLIGVAKAAQGALNYTSAGNGSMGHLTAERIKNLTGVQMQHIAYKGAGPAVQDVLAGTVPVMFGDSTTVLPHIRSGRLRALVVTSAVRQRDMPDTPTLGESGFPGMVADPMGGLATTPGTPPAAINRLTADLKVVLDKADVQEKLRSSAASIATYMTPRNFAAYVNRDFEIWGKVIRDNNIKAN
jgi:tripartite-type tricarboxylate transporter receptor subunit TctC